MAQPSSSTSCVCPSGAGTIPAVDVLEVLVNVWRDVDVLSAFLLSRVCSRFRRMFKACPAYWKVLAGLQCRWDESFSTIPLLLHSSIIGNNPQTPGLPRMPLRYRNPDQRVECPEILRPFLVSPLAGSNFNLCRISFKQMMAMTSSELESAMNAAMEHRVFLIMEGAFEVLKTNLDTWLSDRSSFVAQLSGRDRKGELCTELGSYLSAMRSYEKGLSNFECAWSGALGTFTCKNMMLYQEDLLFLNTHNVFSKFLPWGRASLLRDSLESEQSMQYGPYLFGGDKMRGSCEAAAKDALSNQDCQFGSQMVKRRVRYRGHKKDGLGGSTMHLDGMGSLVAIGGLKCGKKLVTAVEACDASLALKIAGFKSYAKPGGSSFLTNDPVDRSFSGEEESCSLKDLWTMSHVRWGTFEISAGDAYVIPAGMPHEFLNSEPSLSIAWNILPSCEQSSASEPWHFLLLLQALHDVQTDFSGSPDRMMSAIDHAPIPLLVANVFPDLVSVENPMHCASCASKHRETIKQLKGSAGRTRGCEQESPRGRSEFNSSCWECATMSPSKRPSDPCNASKSKGEPARAPRKSFALPRHTAPLFVGTVDPVRSPPTLLGLQLIDALKRFGAPESLPHGVDLLMRKAPNNHVYWMLFEEEDPHFYARFRSMASLRTAVSSMMQGRVKGSGQAISMELIKDKNVVERCNGPLKQIRTVKSLFAFLADSKKGATSQKESKLSRGQEPQLPPKGADARKELDSDRKEGQELSGGSPEKGLREQQKTDSSRKRSRAASCEPNGAGKELVRVPSPRSVAPACTPTSRLDTGLAHSSCSSLHPPSSGIQTGRERRRIERALRVFRAHATNQHGVKVEGQVQVTDSDKEDLASPLSQSSPQPSEETLVGGEGVSMHGIAHSREEAESSYPPSIEASCSPPPHFEEQVRSTCGPLDRLCVSNGERDVSTRLKQFVDNLSMGDFIILKQHVQKRAAELYRQATLEEQQCRSPSG